MESAQPTVDHEPTDASRCGTRNTPEPTMLPTTINDAARSPTPSDTTAGA